VFSLLRVYFPPANKSDALRNYMKTCKKQVVYLAKNKFRFLKSVMPDTVTANGISYTIPQEWKVI